MNKKLSYFLAFFLCVILLTVLFTRCINEGQKQKPYFKDFQVSQSISLPG